MESYNMQPFMTAFLFKLSKIDRLAGHSLGIIVSKKVGQKYCTLVGRKKRKSYQDLFLSCFYYLSIKFIFYFSVVEECSLSFV